MDVNVAARKIQKAKEADNRSTAKAKLAAKDEVAAGNKGAGGAGKKGKGVQGLKVKGGVKKGGSKGGKK